MTELRYFDDLYVRYKHRNDGSTIAILTYEGTNPLVGIGKAKLQPGDHYNQTIGEKIALGRAMIDLGIKGQNRWLLRSRTEAEVNAQRAKKNTVTVDVRVNRQELDELFKDVNTVGRNRPVKKKAK